MLETTREAVRNLKLEIGVDYVTDMEKILDKGVMRMPALAVNERVVSAGKLLSTEEVEALLKRMEV